MTIFEEGKQLRDEAARLRPDRRRRYGDDLRNRILDWIERAHEIGLTDADCGRMLLMKTSRFSRWRKLDGRSNESDTKALIPIEITPSTLARDASMVVISPSGYRVEGLSVVQVIELLRGVA